MKKIFLDTNVVLDFILGREGADKASEIFSLGEEGVYRLCASILTMANTAYIIRKGHTQTELYSLISDLSELLHTLPMDEEHLKEALQYPATDFEDVLQFVCAKRNECDVIITRNVRHFPFLDMKILTPSEFLKSL